MRIVARGWKRDCGANEIMTADLGNGYESVPVRVAASYRPGRVYVRKTSNGDVEILTGPHSLTLGGKYQAVVTLSKDDILHLFAEAFKDVPVLAVAKLIAKVSAGNDDAEDAA